MGAGKRKPAKVAKGAPATSTAPAMPYLVRDPNQIAGGLWLVCERTFCGVIAVARCVYMPGVDLAVRKRIIMDWELPRFTPVPWSEETTLQSFLLGIKRDAVEHGAQAEAVQLLGSLSPFEEKEMIIMAEKLTKKAAPKAAPKKEAAPKKAPAPKKEAADTGPDKRKIAVLKKPHGAREGTKRADLLDAIYKSKTVQDALDAGVSKNDVAWAARAEYIAIA